MADAAVAQVIKWGDFEGIEGRFQLQTMRSEADRVRGLINSAANHHLGGGSLILAAHYRILE